MRESDLTPEFIAERILGWEYDPDPNPIGWFTRDQRTYCELPTFLESEWTGLLLEIADSIGANELYFSKFLKDMNRPCYHLDFYLDESNIDGLKSTERNYAIILAICEAKGL